MISHRTSGLHSLFVLAQIALAIVLYGALVVVFTIWRPLVNLERYVMYGGIIAGALGIEFVQRDRITIQKCLFGRGLLKLHGIAFRQTLWVLIALVLFVTLLKDPAISRVFLITYLAVLYLTLLASNNWLPHWLAANIFSGKREHRTLLVGSAQKLPLILPWLEHKADFGFKTVGMLSEEGARPALPAINGIQVLGTPDDIDRTVRDFSISQVIVLGLPVISHVYHHLTEVCNRHGVRMMMLSDLAERLQHPVIHVEDDGLQFITSRQEPLESPLNRVMKRLLDIGIALTVVIFILPIFWIIVWLIQRFQSKGPVFYRQTRAGLQNYPFEIIKFRTMRNGGHDPTQQATANDARVYPLGRFLRKYSIDELPQFLNVLYGDMSVVGPRPHLVEHNDQFAKLLADYQIRAYIRPGITGLAQVRGHRGEAATTEAIASRLASDTAYLENWSLFIDLAIIVRTAWHVVCPPKTAY